MEQQKPWEEDAGRREGGTICVCVCVCSLSLQGEGAAPPSIIKDIWESVSSQEKPALPPLLSAPPCQGFFQRFSYPKNEYGAHGKHLLGVLHSHQGAYDT